MVAAGKQRGAHTHVLQEGGKSQMHSPTLLGHLLRAEVYQVHQQAHLLQLTPLMQRNASASDGPASDPSLRAWGAPPILAPSPGAESQQQQPMQPTADGATAVPERSGSFKSTSDGGAMGAR